MMRLPTANFFRKSNPVDKTAPSSLSFPQTFPPSDITPMFIPLSAIITIEDNTALVKVYSAYSWVGNNLMIIIPVIKPAACTIA